METPSRWDVPPLDVRYVRTPFTVHVSSNMYKDILLTLPVSFSIGRVMRGIVKDIAEVALWYDIRSTALLGAMKI